jgi:hypothetical protein
VALNRGAVKAAARAPEDSGHDPATPPAPFPIDDIAPDQHRAMADYVEQAAIEVDGSVPPRWRAYCHVIEQAIGLVRAGKLERQRTGEFLRAVGNHYFGGDPDTRFSIDTVVRVFAGATKMNTLYDVDVLEVHSGRAADKPVCGYSFFAEVTRDYVANNPPSSPAKNLTPAELRAYRAGRLHVEGD